MRSETQPTVIVMVGLPARGKTYTARKLCRYLKWQGYKARVFNVGNYRRTRLGSNQPAAFFDPANTEGVNARRAMAEAALTDVLAWLETDGQIAIYDATNATQTRRLWVREQCEARSARVVFVESICDDPDIVEANIRETKLLSPDYVGADPAVAVADFRTRIANYTRAYQPVSDTSLSFVKLVDAGRQVVANEISGFLLGRLVNYLMNLHIVPRTIWLSRHGESEYNQRGRIGGDSSLSPSGRAYAARLASFLPKRIAATPTVWTSTLARTVETAEHLPWESLPLRALDEIDAGVCDGMTYAEIQQQLPDEFDARARDKLGYRYPRGESYRDVIDRLNPVIIDLERKRRPLVIIAHQAVLRALYAYIADETPRDCPHLDIPLHTVIELTPKAYGCQEQRFKL
jgi:broad specificity phosphatase PhoE